MNMKCLSQPNSAPRKSREQGARTRPDTWPSGLSPVSGHPGQGCPDALQAHAQTGGFLVPLNATKMSLSLAPQVHLPWAGAAFQRHASTFGPDSSKSGKLPVFLSLTPPCESGSRPALRARIAPFWRQRPACRPVSFHSSPTSLWGRPPGFPKEGVGPGLRPDGKPGPNPC